MTAHTINWSWRKSISGRTTGPAALPDSTAARRLQLLARRHLSRDGER
ncbi:hypothetical protein ACWY4P_01230 [Streptomyces sp. LZ34]